MKRTYKTQALVLAGMLLALGVVLPYVTAHGIGIPGNILLPMHIPVFLCGLLCGPLYGSACGLLLPLLNSVLTGGSMPSVYPTMPMMMCELCVYGLVSGLLYCKTGLGKRKIGVYVSMIVAMICGRAAYGGALSMLMDTNVKALGVWASFVTGLPGVIVQILLVPTLVFTTEGIFKLQKSNAFASAKNLIKQQKATCVVIKQGKILSVESGRGVRPVIALYEQGMLKNAIVVDKIIGKAAAMVLVLGGVRVCYGETMSRAAFDFLNAHGVRAEYGTLTERIINRQGDGICPMEQTVAEINDPAIALEALKVKVAELMALAEKEKENE